ncbi:hypothetical protein ACOQFV_17745 [Nocardiopsis changdeensis]|uniref:PD-(D/E)XK endonuclease-like domain-containing protein n=1 Tax=Nocardiopsis changdeensis TaxID=2831969 RepID=A0ABX8BT61_9ACTN|nr:MULTISPECIES: hypothetical protein [Nocardiopsis]QUX24006.1 hypothetical protein KGD84_06695 [Nocardiopsis changdeensis]QYX34402.1 hypothetical protein K1J57_16150 [Nocardiopsis sp. MT53]
MPFTRPTKGSATEHALLLRCVEGIRERSARAVPWEPDTVGIPRGGSESPLSRINDVAFYANARNDVAALAGVCAELLRLHHPVEEEGGTCAGCGLAWPCPTFEEISRLLA